MKRVNNSLVLTFLLVAVGNTHAVELPETTADSQRHIDRLERQRQREEIQNEKAREMRIQQNGFARDGLPDTPKGVSRHQFRIKEVIVVDDDKYEFSPQRNAIIASYTNSDMGEQEVLLLVKELTNFYIEKGYVTTLVTIVPGSLRTEKLILKVLWGKTAGFLYNGKVPGWREEMRLFSAMPFSTGNALNISDIDQGLDNLMRVSPDDKLQIQPTDVSGYSMVVHQGEPVFPLSVHAGINNSGPREEGWNQYYLNSSLRNILGLNDIFSYYYSWNDLDARTDSQAAKNFSVSVPLGYWSFDSSYYKSKYKKVIGGNYGGYVSDGQSERISFKASRTLYRNANGKYTGYIKVEKRDNQNNIMGFPIAVSSKNYSSVNSGLTWVGGIAGGWGYYDLSITTGVPWFNSAGKNDSDLAGFDINYKKYNGILSWSKRLASSDSGRFGLEYELNSGFQFTNDRLVSEAKYSLGDEFTVRGFKESGVSAERALWLSHTLRTPVTINYARIYQISPFTGFDIGMARRNCPASVSVCDRDYMSGATVGIKASGKDFSGSLASAWPVKKPASLKNSKIDNQALYFNLDVGF